MNTDKQRNEAWEAFETHAATAKRLFKASDRAYAASDAELGTFAHQQGMLSSERSRAAMTAFRVLLAAEYPGKFTVRTIMEY